MSLNAVEIFQINFEVANRHFNSCACVVTEGLLSGASQDYMDRAMALYVEAKAAKELAWQEYKQFTLPPSRDSE